MLNRQGVKMQNIILIIMLLMTATVIYSQNSCPGIPAVTYQGRTYNTVQIGTQCWLKENLNVGKKIDGGSVQSDNGLIEKYCYNNDESNCGRYGGLYQWGEAVQYRDGASYNSSPGSALSIQGICPNGWHIPTNAEFQTLGTSENNNSNALKAVGQGSGNGAGTNRSGFSALLAGNRHYDGPFFTSLGNFIYSWSSTEDDSAYAYVLILAYDNNKIYSCSYNKEFSFSVRCLKD